MSKLIESLKWWFFRRIVAKEVWQGDHQAKISNMYRIIADAARKEFTEDNKQTLDGLLIELHQFALSELPHIPFYDRKMRSPVKEPINLPNVTHHVTLEILNHGVDLYLIVFNGNYLYTGDLGITAFYPDKVDDIVAKFSNFYPMTKFNCIRDERGRDY